MTVILSPDLRCVKQHCERKRGNCERSESHGSSLSGLSISNTIVVDCPNPATPVAGSDGSLKTFSRVRSSSGRLLAPSNTANSGAATSTRGRPCPPIRSGGSSTSRPTRPRTTTSAAFGRGTICTATASSRWTSGRASASGTSRVCITTCGTATSRCLPRLWISPWTGSRSRRWCRTRSRRSSTRSTE